jgi:hypothetical protein
MRKRMNWRELFSWRNLTVGVMFAGVGAGAFFLGRSGVLSEATARPPSAVAQATPPAGEQSFQEPAAPAPSANYTKGVVAYIYGTVPITREELGEYLIARLGAERLEPFVNKRIIEYHAMRQGAGVTAAEIEADLEETLRNFNGGPISRDVFENKVLKARGKTLYEWKEDVIRPKLLMHKLCRDRVRVEEEDLKRGYEAYYGEKVQVQMILWPKEEHHVAKKKWDEIRKDAKAFNKAAREQASAELARGNGIVQPFGRHTTGSAVLEREAFDNLEVGEVSGVIETPQGYVVLKVLQRIPPQTDVKLEEVRDKLEKEIIDKKVLAEVQVLFAELQKQADPRLLLKKGETQEQLERDVRREIAPNMIGPGITDWENPPLDKPSPTGGVTGSGVFKPGR